MDITVLKAAVEAVTKAKTVLDKAKSDVDNAQLAYDKVVKDAGDAHAKVIEWVTDNIPSLKGATGGGRNL